MGGKSLARQQAEEMEEAEGRAARSAYNPGFNRRATDYCLLGATNEELAAFFNVHLSSVEQWLVEIPSFARAVSRGREVANVRVVKALHAAATGYKHDEVKLNVVKGKLRKTVVTKHYPPSVNAAALILMNRDSKRWKDTKTVEHSGRIDLAALVTGSMGDGAKVIEGTAKEDDATT
jgi:hypothetical protein